MSQPMTMEQIEERVDKMVPYLVCRAPADKLRQMIVVAMCEVVGIDPEEEEANRACYAHWKRIEFCQGMSKRGIHRRGWNAGLEWQRGRKDKVT